jgi:hypothetical protein
VLLNEGHDLGLCRRQRIRGEWRARPSLVASGPPRVLVIVVSPSPGGHQSPGYLAFFNLDPRGLAPFATEITRASGSLQAAGTACSILIVGRKQDSAPCYSLVVATRTLFIVRIARTSENKIIPSFLTVTVVLPAGAGIG